MADSDTESFDLSPDLILDLTHVFITQCSTEDLQNIAVMSLAEWKRCLAICGLMQTSRDHASSSPVSSRKVSETTAQSLFSQAVHLLEPQSRQSTVSTPKLTMCFRAFVAGLDLFAAHIDASFVDLCVQSVIPPILRTHAAFRPALVGILNEPLRLPHHDLNSAQLDQVLRGVFNAYITPTTGSTKPTPQACGCDGSATLTPGAVLQFASDFRIIPTELSRVLVVRAIQAVAARREVLRAPPLTLGVPCLAESQAVAHDSRGFCSTTSAPPPSASGRGAVRKDGKDGGLPGGGLFYCEFESVVRAMACIRECSPAHLLGAVGCDHARAVAVRLQATGRNFTLPPRRAMNVAASAVHSEKEREGSVVRRKDASSVTRDRGARGTSERSGTVSRRHSVSRAPHVAETQGSHAIGPIAPRAASVAERGRSVVNTAAEQSCAPRGRSSSTARDPRPRPISTPAGPTGVSGGAPPRTPAGTVAPRRGIDDGASLHTPPQADHAARRGGSGGALHAAAALLSPSPGGLRSPMCGTRSLEVEKAMVQALRVLYKVYAVPLDQVSHIPSSFCRKSACEGPYGDLVLPAPAFVAMLADAGVLNVHFTPQAALSAAKAGAEGGDVERRTDLQVLRRRSGRQRAATPTTHGELQRDGPEVTGGDCESGEMILTAATLGPALRAVALGRFPHLDPHDARCALAARMIPLGSKHRASVVPAATRTPASVGPSIGAQCSAEVGVGDPAHEAWSAGAHDENARPSSTNGSNWKYAQKGGVPARKAGGVEAPQPLRPAGPHSIHQNFR